MLTLPCCRRCGSVGCGDEGAFATGSEESSIALSVAVWGGGAWSMSTMDLEAFGCGRLRPRGGDRHHGTARQLKATEMWLKTSGSAAGASAAGGKGCPVGWGVGEAESRGVDNALGGLASGWALSGARLKLFPVVGGGGERVSLSLYPKPSLGQ